jgi:L-seryl-tRNA(Ser) seleniumtransferase
LQRLAAVFRSLIRPVIERVADGALVFDLRCLNDEAAFVGNFGELRARLS